MTGLDTTVMPWRPDLAAASLADRWPAARHVEGKPYHAVAATVPLRGAPDATASATTELLFGEAFTVYEIREGWAWGQMAVDDYVGWAPLAGLAPGLPRPDRRVTALRTLVWPRPDLKAPPLMALSFLTPVRAVEAVPGYVRIAAQDEPVGWVAESALGPIEGPLEPDLAATALRFLEVPYLWGGRSSLGLDCSGLAQIAAAAAGWRIDRDTRRQARLAGRALPEGSRPERGDLIFFPGHVGIALDAERIVHATAAGHRVRVEPIETVAARSRAAGGRGVTVQRRLVRVGDDEGR